MRTINMQSVCDKFIQALADVEQYIEKCNSVFNDNDLYLSYSYENAAIMVYKSFEAFSLRIMMACLNHDHSHFEASYSVKLGRHINDDICEFLITKGGFFDFKGYSGLCKIVGETIGKSHNITKIFKNQKYRIPIEQLCAIRNYSAHNSTQSKQSAMKAFNLQRISSAGSCLKRQNRLQDMINSFKALANDVKTTPIQ